MTDRIIYDFGANTGLNIPYYLQKAEKVVAVEANRVLADDLKTRFQREIGEGRLVVVDKAITTRLRDHDDVSFYVYAGPKESGHVLSSLHEPAGDDAFAFQRTTVSSTDAHELFHAHGSPFFVKIDLEHCDATVLRDVLSWTHLPTYLSVEAHNLEVFAVLLFAKHYKRFQIVRGSTIHSEFASHPVRVGTEVLLRSFPPHSAGPFGEDLPDSWLSRAGLIREFGLVGPGWIDIHAALGDGGADPTGGSSRRHQTASLGVGGAREFVVATWRLVALVASRVPGAIRHRVTVRQATSGRFSKG